MKIINQGYEIVSDVSWDNVLKHLEKCGRVCYKSDNKITEHSAKEFIEKIIKAGHESVLEHYSLTIKFTFDRGLLGELTRHRHLSFSVESSRYVNYKDGDICFIYKKPSLSGPIEYDDTEMVNRLTSVFECAEHNYKELIRLGYKPQEARKVLPMGLVTELYATGNIRTWRHVLRLRCAKNAHPEMRDIMLSLLSQLRRECPVLFNDIFEDIVGKEHV